MTKSEKKKYHHTVRHLILCQVFFSFPGKKYKYLNRNEKTITVVSSQLTNEPFRFTPQSMLAL